MLIWHGDVGTPAPQRGSVKVGSANLPCPCVLPVFPARMQDSYSSVSSEQASDYSRPKASFGLVLSRAYGPATKVTLIRRGVTRSLRTSLKQDEARPAACCRPVLGCRGLGLAFPALLGASHIRRRCGLGCCCFCFLCSAVFVTFLSRPRTHTQDDFRRRPGRTRPLLRRPQSWASKPPYPNHP